MNVHDLLAWSGPALDALVLIGLAVTWFQLRHDPTVAWREYEERLRELQESLRLLVLQAEGEARDLDRRLAAHAEHLGEISSERAAKSTAKDARPRVTDEVPSAPHAGDDEPHLTPLAAAMAATATVPPPPPAPKKPAPSLAERVQQLAAAQTPIAEIARRLSLPIAEARVLAGLTTGGLGFGPAPAPGAAPTARVANGRIAS